jgi:hypothetical protein
MSSLPVAYKYKIYCETEEAWKDAGSRTTPPTKCPTNPAHTVKLDSVSAQEPAPPPEVCDEWTYGDHRLYYQSSSRVVKNEIQLVRVKVVEGAEISKLAVYAASLGFGVTAWAGIYEQPDPDEVDWTLADGKPTNLLAMTLDTGEPVLATGEGWHAFLLRDNSDDPVTWVAQQAGYYWLALKFYWATEPVLKRNQVSPQDWLSTLVAPSGVFPRYERSYATAGLPDPIGTITQAASSIIYVAGR